jgi:hypothetical protein
VSLAAGLNDGYARAFQWAAAFCVAALAASFVVPAIRPRASRARASAAPASEVPGAEAGQRPAPGTGR